MIYLDYNSTTPVDPRVLEAMLPYFSQKFGNAVSKTHSYGWVAEAAVEKAREQVANLIGATPQEIIFTSGATESINLAIKGVCNALAPLSGGEGRGGEVITVRTEHKAVLDTCKHLEAQGLHVTYLGVDRQGYIDLDELKRAVTPKTKLVSVMFANNETGTIQPVSEIARVAHEHGCFFMTDATQAAGKVQVAVNSPSPEGRGLGGGVDLLCLSSHKFYGPKGIGALYVRRKDPRVTLHPLLHGGGHERGLRPGTLNVPGIVGFGKACEIAGKELWEDAQRISQLRTLLEQSLCELGNVHVNGSVKDRLPNTTNLMIAGIKADELIAKLPDLAFSTGSACTSAVAEPSHVLSAMGLTEKEAYASVRFSLGKFTTAEEVNAAAEQLKAAIASLAK